MIWYTPKNKVSLCYKKYFKEILVETEDFLKSINNPYVHRHNFRVWFFSLRYLLNIPGPLDIPASLCKGNFDDEMFNHQVPYLWLIYWWDIYFGEKWCIRGLHLLFTTELHYIKINLLLKSLKQNWRDAKVYSLLKKIKRRIPL